jgi:hypothetical protein
MESIIYVGISPFKANLLAVQVKVLHLPPATVTNDLGESVGVQHRRSGQLRGWQFHQGHPKR